MKGGQAPKATAAVDKATAKFEVDFLTRMIDHHQAGVEMARMCAKRAVRAPLRDKARGMSAAQTSEISTMQRWLADWYDESHQPMTMPDMQAEMKRLRPLRGSEFEIGFMKSMIGHHSTAITEAKKALDRSAHRDLIAMCRDVVEKQGAEISEMTDWLCQWHDLCEDSRSKRHS